MRLNDKLNVIVAAALLALSLIFVASAHAQVTVDYSTTIESGTPLSFAIENGGALTGSLLAAVQALGVTAGRNDVEMVTPNTTLSAYQSALAAGCPSGSVCDPSTWNWSAENNILATRSAFGKVFAIMHAGNAAMDSCGVRTLCWLLTGGNPAGQILDFNVWEDIVKKIVQHTPMDYIEVNQEPDGTCCGQSYPPNTYWSQYYYHTAHAIRSVNSTVPIGGAVTGTPNLDYMTAIPAANLPANYLNFIDFHNYIGPTLNTTMCATARTYFPNIPCYVTEWNWDSNTTNIEDNDAQETVNYVGNTLIQMFDSGQGGNYFAVNPYSASSGANWFDPNGNLYQKAYVYRLMSQKLGLGAGLSSVKAVTAGTNLVAMGATNSAGNPVMAASLWQSTSQPTTFTFNNIPNGTYPLQTYLVDYYHGDQAATPVESTNVTVTNNTLVHNFTMPDWSVVGIILQTLSTPAPTPTSTATPTAVPTSTQTTYDDTDPSIIYSTSPVAFKGWTAAPAPDGLPDFDGTQHYSNGCVNPPQTATSVQGPLAAINFIGTSITLIGEKGPNFGIGAYALDGGPLTTVDAYHSPQIFQQPLVTLTGLTNAPHVLSYQVTCNKNAAATDFYQVIDAYTVTGTNNPFANAAKNSQVGGNITLNGSGWSCGTVAQDISGGHCWDGTAGDSVQWNFTGSLAEVFIRPDVGDGYFDVQIDGTTVAHDVSGQYTTVDNDQLTAWMAFAENGLSAGTHTIKLIVDGSAPYPNESESSGQKNLLQFDVGLAFPATSSTSTPTPTPPTPTPVPTSTPTPAGCTISLVVPSTVASPITFAPTVTGCAGWPSASGFVRVEQTAPYPTHFDGNAGTTSTNVPLGAGTYTDYVTLWSNSVTQIGGPSNSVSFTVSGATASPTPAPPTPTPTAAPTPIPLTAGAYQLQTGDYSFYDNETPPTATPVPTSSPVPLNGGAYQLQSGTGYVFLQAVGTPTATPTP